MNGKAIIVGNADFSAKGLGRVTLLNTTPLSSMTISPELTSTNVYTFSVVYNPSDTYQRGVSWEIVTGGSFASISEDGVLTIGMAADNSTITVRATSSYNESVIAEYTAQYTYDDPNRITYTDNLYISSTGVENTNSGNFTSDFIPVEPLTQLTISGHSGSNELVIEYASDKTTLNDFWRSNTTITLKATTRYIRVVHYKRTNGVIRIKDSAQNDIYYNPKLVLYGKYLIDVGEPTQSFRWAVTGTDTTKGVSCINTNFSQVDTFQQKGTRTCTAAAAFKYLVSSTSLSDSTITANGSDFTFSYNTTKY